MEALQDFVFGTFSTDALRIEQQRLRRGGITHHNRRAPLAPRPGQQVQLELTVGPQQDCVRAWVYWSTGDEDPAGSVGRASRGHVVEMAQAEVEWELVEWGYVRRFSATLPAQPENTLVRYYMTAERSDGSETRSDGGKYFAYYVTDLTLPEWARRAVVYQILPDRFYPGNGRSWLAPASHSGFYGGTLRGILEKLDYLSDLGVDVLWLNPIFPSPSHHGYDATDLFSIEPRLGSLEDFRQLVDESHRAGIKILLDFVPNHWSWQHPSFQEAITDRNSSMVGWYTFKHWPDDYATFFHVKSLPKLNLRNPAARQHILDSLKYWLDFGVDGYRMDHAIGPTPDFWAEVRRLVAGVKPEAWTFGEVVEPPDDQLSFFGGLDGCLDFMLLEALRSTFAFGRWNAGRFNDFLERHEGYFPEEYSRPSFLDNHDMNRFLWAARNQKALLKLAAMCQFTLSAPPVVYYGTEIGLSQQRDVRQGGHGIPEESRLPMLWGVAQDGELLQFYRALIALRRQRSCLVHGRRTTIPAGPEIVAYSRSDQESALATALNLSDKPQRVTISGGWKQILLATDPGCRIMTRADTTQANTTQAITTQADETIVELPAQGGVILG